MYDMEASLAWRAPTSAPARSAGSVRNEPGGLNSSVVPSASPAASPSRQPRNRSRSAAPLKRRRPVTVRSNCGRRHAAVLSAASDDTLVEHLALVLAGATHDHQDLSIV